MRQALVVLLGLALLGGCGRSEEPRHKRANDARDVAMVERMNQTPLRPIKPEAFSGDDLERYGLAHAGCSFRVGDSPDAPPLFVAQHDRGFLKVAGTVRPLAVKSGSSELPSGAYSTYMGLDSWIELVAQAGEKGQDPAGRQTWPSRLVIHDAEQRVAFDALGQVSCAAIPASK